MTEIYRPKLAHDWDDCTADTAPNLARRIQAISPIPYSLEQLMTGRVTRAQNPALHSLRQGVLLDHNFIRETPLMPGVDLAIPILHDFFRQSILTGKPESCYVPIVDVLVKHQLYFYYDNLYLRPDDQEDHLKHKDDTAQAEDIEVVVEDEGKVALLHAEKKRFVVLIDHPEWNGGIPNGPNLRRYRQIADFAIDFLTYGSYAAFLEAHRNGQIDRNRPDFAHASR